MILFKYILSASYECSALYSIYCALNIYTTTNKSFAICMELHSSRIYDDKYIKL